MKLLLKFANYDGGNSNVIEFDENGTVLDLKQAVLRAWPSNYEKCSDISALRIVSMGRMLDDDKKTVAASGVAKMDYPTPLHVMVRPASAPKPPVTKSKEG